MHAEIFSFIQGSDKSMITGSCRLKMSHCQPERAAVGSGRSQRSGQLRKIPPPITCVIEFKAGVSDLSDIGGDS